MNKDTETFFVNKCSSMNFSEICDYINNCFKHLENLNKNSVNAKNVPHLRETYDSLIQILENKLTQIDVLQHCKNEMHSFEGITASGIKTKDFRTLIDCYRTIELDIKNIESNFKLTKLKIEGLLLLLLKNSLSEIKIASSILDSPAPFYEIFNLLNQLSKSNNEIQKAINDYRCQSLLKAIPPKLQVLDLNKYAEFDKWLNPNGLTINLKRDFLYLSMKVSFYYSRSKEQNWSNWLDKAERSNNLELKLRLHRVINYGSHDEESIKRICAERYVENGLTKLLQLEESISDSINKQNTDKILINELFSKYISSRNNRLADINSAIKKIFNDVSLNLRAEIERRVIAENIDSDLKSSKLLVKDIENLRDKLFKYSTHKMLIEEVFWDLLPQGTWKTEGLIQIFKGFGWNNDEFDEKRLTQIIKILKPNVCYIGKAKFQGYVVFGFDSTQKVVLECPKYGNAIYIINDRWQEITKLSKWEARKLDEVKVIRHSTTSFERLKEALEKTY